MTVGRFLMRAAVCAVFSYSVAANMAAPSVRPPAAIPSPKSAADCPDVAQVCGSLVVILAADGSATAVDDVSTFATFPDGAVTYSPSWDVPPVCPATLEEGPLGLTVLAASPTAVSEGGTLALIVAAEGPCTVAEGVVTLY